MNKESFAESVESVDRLEGVSDYSGFEFGSSGVSGPGPGGSGMFGPARDMSNNVYNMGWMKSSGGSGRSAPVIKFSDFVWQVISETFTFINPPTNLKWYPLAFYNTIFKSKCIPKPFIIVKLSAFIG